MDLAQVIWFGDFKQDIPLVVCRDSTANHASIETPSPRLDFSPEEPFVVISNGQRSCAFLLGGASDAYETLLDETHSF